MATSPRTWEHVLAGIEHALVAGTLRAGDRLPAERQLAAELGIARSSVREAVRALEVLGLVRPQTGSGPHAGAVLVAAPQHALAALLRLQVAARGLPVTDVVDTRLVLETTTVRALAAKGGDLTTASEQLDAMAAPDLSAAEFLALDAGFHLALANGAGNAVIAAIMAGLRSAIESYVLAGTSGIADWPATARRLRSEHRAILDAVAAGEATHAAELVSAHITGYYAEANLAAYVPSPDHQEETSW